MEQIKLFIGKALDFVRSIEVLRSLKFLEAISFVIAAASVEFFPEHAVTSAVVLGIVIAALKFLGIKPELEVKAMLKTNEKSKVAVKKQAAKKSK